MITLTHDDIATIVDSVRSAIYEGQFYPDIPDEAKIDLASLGSVVTIAALGRRNILNTGNIWRYMLARRGNADQHGESS